MGFFHLGYSHTGTACSRFVQHDAKFRVAAPLMQSAPVSVMELELICFTTTKVSHMGVDETYLSVCGPGPISPGPLLSLPATAADALRHTAGLCFSKSLQRSHTWQAESGGWYGLRGGPQLMRMTAGG